MFGAIPTRKTYVVQCKRCQREIPAGRNSFPSSAIVVPCPLCGELRRYRPTEIYLGTPHALLQRQAHG